MQAGNYNTVFTWKKASTKVKDATTGFDSRTHADNGSLWGNLVYTAGNIEEDAGSKQGKVRATIRLRQWVPLSTFDELYSTQFNELFKIEGVRKSLDPVETVVDCWVYESNFGW